MNSQEFEAHSFEAIAAELVRSVGVQDAKSSLVRFGYGLGRGYIPQQVKMDKVSSWRDIVERFLVAQGFDGVEIEINLSPRGTLASAVGGLRSRILFHVGEASRMHFLRPWLVAGWCSGYSLNQLGKDLFFRVVRVPSASCSVCELEGQEELAWTDTEAEPMVDYVRFRKSVHETRSLAMRVCLDRLRDIAMSGASVFLQADRLDGPDYLARYIHHHSERTDKPFVFLEARSLDENLFENAILSAAHGTIFVQSIEAIPLAFQRRLATVAQLGNGSLDVRIVASSERSLATLHRDGRVVSELVRTLQGHEVLVPSIRMRMEDLIPLSRRMLQRLSPSGLPEKLQFSPAVLNEFLHYGWPGGLRELRNVILTMMERRREDEFVLDIRHLPNYFGNHQIYAGATTQVGMTLAEAERKLILTTLQKARGNKRECSRILGIGYNTLWRKLRSYEESARKGRRSSGGLGGESVVYDT